MYRFVRLNFFNVPEYNVTNLICLLAAVQVLLSRVEKTQQLPASSNREEEYTMDLATDLMQAAIDCRGKVFLVH